MKRNFFFTIIGLLVSVVCLNVGAAEKPMFAKDSDDAGTVDTLTFNEISEPTSPVQGTLYRDADDLYYYDGSDWGVVQTDTPEKAYTIDNGSWAQDGTLPAARSYSSIVVTDDYVCLYGGANYVSSVSAPVSDPTNFTTYSSMFTGSSAEGFIPAIIGSYVYLFGCFNFSNIYRAPLSTPMTMSDQGSSGISVGELLSSKAWEIGTGLYIFSYNTSKNIYSASVDTPTSWSDSGSDLSARNALGGEAIIGDYIYIFGGLTDMIQRAPVSDPLSWSDTGNNIPNNAMSMHLAIIGNYIYLFGGSSSDKIRRASINAPSTWETLTDTLPANLWYSQVAIVGEKIYLYGGITSGDTDKIYSTSLSKGSTDQLSVDLTKNPSWIVK